MLLLFTERLNIESNRFGGGEEVEIEFSFEHTDFPTYLAFKWRLDLTLRRVWGCTKDLENCSLVVVLAWGFLGNSANLMNFIFYVPQ